MVHNACCRDGHGFEIDGQVEARPRRGAAGRGRIPPGEQRARHLHVNHCLVGVGDKLSALRKLQANLQLERQQTAFIGDDLNDLTVRPATGLLICPADGARGLRRQADWILRRRGGDGAVRELAEALLQQRGLLQSLNHEGWREGNA